MPNEQPRYAIYYTPPRDDPLTRAAARWLGRDAFAGTGERDGIADEDRHLTADPRRYGFHATIKPPFRLRHDRTASGLRDALARYCAGQPAVPIGPLRVARLASFFALVPVAAPPALQVLADGAVAGLDGFRAPPTDDELQRRLRSRLDDSEKAHLMRWGYPYVFDRFRFHMTLTGAVDAESRDRIGGRLDALFSDLAAGQHRIDALTLFVQPDAQSDFVVDTSFPLLAGEAG